MTWEEYFFKIYPRGKLIQWAHQLKYFRIFRAHGGLANDADSLDLTIKYGHESELKEIMLNLGITLKVHSSQPPQPIPGKSYSYQEMSSFPSLISGTRFIEQPGKHTINGIELYFWCERSKIKVTKHGSLDNGYSLCQLDIDHASSVEPIFKPFESNMVDPPLKIMNYFCRENYPDLFK